MPNKMLIDASHPEETRVVVLRGNRVEEFDFESADKKQLRGNIYLAKVTRVEPSLQAAFVDYGGNRHGFLAFPEIHPDYYQVPVVDRQTLIEDEARAQRDDDEDEQRTQRRSRRFRDRNNNRRADRRRNDDEARGEAVVGELPEASSDAGVQDGAHAESGVANVESEPAGSEPAATAETLRTNADDAATEAIASRARETLFDDDLDRGIESRSETSSIEPSPSGSSDLVADEVEAMAATESRRSRPSEQSLSDTGELWSEENGSLAVNEDPAEIEQIGGDALEEVPVHRHRYRKQYKIQEVIKRRQILLVQVVKEERGNKGAALTTYLSLAGRYSVLMPNTARGGGISRKITDTTDRQRLKSIVQELEVPEGMGVILRTAGAARTKAEVKRDFEYLLRMWETVRETTLKSTAPTLVYEEGSLIKRAIRDLYSKDIDEVVVAGEDGYREAKEFMRLLMPSHAKNIQPYRDPQPVFAKHGVESQLDAMFSNQVTLKSGGYIVINQTEALVAIDVNSGRSTREHNIEDTALRTNLEAVDEIARQLRLRDLAGLIVLDLIDMEESRNNRAVERRLKDALKNDRARIQVGTISHFGLLEMSRQRIRSGVLEASTVVCPHCAGSGTLRATASIALHILRVIEDALIKSASYDLTVKAGTTVALYILNQKRAHLRDLESRFGVSIAIEVDNSLTGPTYYALERGELATGTAEPAAMQPLRVARTPNGAAEVPHDLVGEDEDVEAPAEADGAGLPGEADESGEVEADSEVRARRRRRRRRGRGGDREVSGIAPNAPQPPDDALGAIARFGGLEPQGTTEAQPTDVPPEPEVPVAAAVEEAPLVVAAAPEASDRRRSRRTPRAPQEVVEAQPAETEAANIGDVEPAVPEADLGAEPARPTRARRTRRTPKARPNREELGAAEEVEAPVEAPVLPENAGSSAPELEPTGLESAAPTEAEGSAAEGSDKSESESLVEDRPKRSGWWRRAKASSRS